jgi:hypothetical protein
MLEIRLLIAVMTVLARRGSDIVVSELGNRAGILGGAYLANEHRLDPDALDRELEGRIGASGPAARLGRHALRDVQSSRSASMATTSS